MKEAEQFSTEVIGMELQGLPSVALSCLCYREKYPDAVVEAAERYILNVFQRATKSSAFQ